jgi:hypothetical protein
MTDALFQVGYIGFERRAPLSVVLERLDDLVEKLIDPVRSYPCSAFLNVLC